MYRIALKYLAEKLREISDELGKGILVKSEVKGDLVSRVVLIIHIFIN